ncbi:hypothetical protein TKK_0005395 [Trichogramma kaykai]|uniref:Uncharacterized protein n=1 Tax=Trichogramma kaykai TaxID=54128 RepID=A0ABD2XHQ6_9HYME
MQEFCPVCMKNGIQTQIKCYQKDLEEAIFMCPSVECPWPFEFQDPIKIKRPILPIGNKNWDEIPQRYLKKNKTFQKDVLDFTLCATPQIPSSNHDINGVQNTDIIAVPEVLDGMTQSVLVDCGGEKKPFEFTINCTNSFDDFNQTSINDVLPELQQSIFSNSVSEELPVKYENSKCPVKNEGTVSNVSSEKSSVSQNYIQPVVIQKKAPRIIQNECLSTNLCVKKVIAKKGPILVQNKENSTNNRIKQQSKLRVKPSFSSFSAPITKFNFDEFKSIKKQKIESMEKKETESTKNKEIVQAIGCYVNYNKLHQNKDDPLPQAVNVQKLSQDKIVNNTSGYEGKDALFQLDAKINELNNSEQTNESNKFDFNGINFDDLLNGDNSNCKNESQKMLNLENNCTDINVNCNVFSLNDTSTETNQMELDLESYLSSITF